MRLIGLISLIGPMGLMGCSGDAAPTLTDNTVHFEVAVARTGVAKLRGSGAPSLRAAETYDGKWYYEFAEALANNATTQSTQTEGIGLYVYNRTIPLVANYSNAKLAYTNGSWLCDAVPYVDANKNFFAYAPYTNPSDVTVTMLSTGNEQVTWQALPCVDDKDHLISHEIVKRVGNEQTGYHVPLHMDHIYSRLEVRFSIADAAYASMRTIRITKVTVRNLPSTITGHDVAAAKIPMTFLYGDDRKLSSTSPALLTDNVLRSNGLNVYPDAKMDVTCSHNQSTAGNLQLTDYVAPENIEGMSSYGSMYVLPTDKYTTEPLYVDVTYDVLDKGTLEVRHAQKVRTITLTNSQYTPADGGSPLSTVGYSYRVNIRIAPQWIYELSDYDQSGGYSTTMVVE